MKPRPSSKIVRRDSVLHGEIASYSLKEVGSPLSGKIDIPANQIGGHLSTIEREAYERGFASGEQAGRELGLKEVETSYRAVFKLIEELNKAKNELLKTSDQDIVKIALAVAQRILHHAIQQNPEEILGHIHRAIKSLGQSEAILIRVNPEDLQRLSDKRDKLLEGAEGKKSLRFESDANIPAGECLIESRERIVDNRIDSQLSILCQEMQKELDKEMKKG